ncbi:MULTISPECIES: helix-turn-helix domain-containing protein [unclassified Acidithiobacillus]|uniref:helix-turn-helix domain-containing protein n=1 Tax=unclassified Acidithiobacillus TaxID=2614800 RepID=UPI001D0D54BB|nr:MULTISPECIES: hypothetical protein [unclassified Acidithiobacillus]
MKITGLHADVAVLAELGARIAGRRVELQLTQAAVAEQAGVAKRTLERMEAGQILRLQTGGGCAGGCSARGHIRRWRAGEGGHRMEPENQ